MKPFAPLHADGTRRNCRANARRLPVKPKPWPPRTKRGNGKLGIDGRSTRGRRLHELIRAYGRELDLEDERTAGLVTSTANLAVEAERLEDASMRGKSVDLELLNRLINTRERNLEKLEAMRTGARAQAGPSLAGNAPGPGRWPNALARYLHWMSWAEQRCGNASPTGHLREELLAEYDRREAGGEFVGCSVNGFVCGGGFKNTAH
jgi:hypothetical protein